MSTVLEPVALIKDYAIIVDPSDNVAVVKNETALGLELALPNETVIEMRDAVSPGHRFATREIPEGEYFLWIMAAIREGEDRKYGVVNVQPEFAAGGSGLEAVAEK